MITKLTVGMPLWDTAVPTEDGIKHRRTLEYIPRESGIQGPLGRVARAYLDQHPSHPKFDVLSTVSVEDLAGQSQLIMRIDDQTWKDQGFWPTSDWYPVV